MTALGQLLALMDGQMFYPVCICNDCINLDWTIKYSSTITTVNPYAADG